MLTNLATSTAVQTLVIENFVLTTVIEQAFIKKAEKEKKRKEKKLNIAIFLLTVQNQQRFEP